MPPVVITGAVVWRAQASTPSGYLACNGLAVSRTTFADLFAVIGTTYGAGDGSTTFNVPDLTTRYPVGADAGVTISRGGTGGTVNHTHNGPSHTHAVTEPGAHSDHASAGDHTHDGHGSASLTGGTGTTSLGGPATHSTAGGHTHDAHSAHSGSATQSSTGATGQAEPPFVELRPVIKT